MELQEVIKGIKCKVLGDSNIQIRRLVHNSDDVQEGDVFFCLRGTNVDGHDYAKLAVKKGAAVCVLEEEIKGLNCCQVIVENSRQTMSKCASNYFKNPSKDLVVIGVTGTNGKTTSTYLLKSVLETAGKSVAIIGTNGVIFNGQKIETNMTTPDPIILQELLYKIKANGVEYVCMEMSAHAAHLQKLWGVMTDIILFTNLTQDHLDYFGNMENYGNAKISLFNKKFADYAVINADDSFGRKIARITDLPYLTYSLNDKSSDIKANNIKQTNNGCSYTLNFHSSSVEIEQNLFGKFNISNCLGVIGASLLLGIDMNTIKRGIEKVNFVPGRFNVKNIAGVKYIVDYAHTPDGLENVLRAAREICDGNLISVFGCGGDRDRTKRAIMGEVSSNLADFSIITSDNPRYENPKSIINDIISQYMLDNYTTEIDRRKAIRKAADIATPGDVVVISGKGVENYIDQNGHKRPYSDYEVLEEIESAREY